MNRWWRAYDGTLHDPKVQRLQPPLFKAWFNLLCIASKNNGVLPPIASIAFELRLTERKAADALSALTEAKLFDLRADGQIEPHNWSGRQYQSDGSSERVKRHRDKRVAAGLERQWVPPKELREAVYKRDYFKCVYCGSGQKLSLDHRTPEIRGGTHDIENLATACMSCNGAKRDLTESEFRSRNGISNVDETLLKRPQTTEAEEITERENKQDAADAAKKYAFEAGVIRLNERDFTNWKASFSYLDVPAELIGASKWAGEQGQNWFYAVSGLLAKRNRDAKAAKERTKDSGFKSMSGIDGVI